MIVWLLDIDGVINACTKKPDRNVWPAEAWFTGRAEADGRSWPIAAATPVVDFIRDVHEKGRAEIRWHTTWQHDAANLAKLLDLPDFPVQDAPEFARVLRARSDQWWKLPAAERVVAEGHALVWTDDDAGDPWSLPGDARDAIVAAAPALILAPSTTTGLTPKHLRKIDAFLTANGGERS